MSYLAHRKSEAIKAVRAAFRRVKNDVRREPFKLFVAAIAGIAASFLFSATLAAIWALFVLFLVYDWDARIAIVLGAFSFLLCLVFAIVGDRAWAEVSAVYAYFFFAVAGIIWFVEYADLRDRATK